MQPNSKIINSTLVLLYLVHLFIFFGDGHLMRGRRDQNDCKAPQHIERISYPFSAGQARHRRVRSPRAHPHITKRGGLNSNYLIPMHIGHTAGNRSLYRNASTLLPPTEPAPISLRGTGFRSQGMPGNPARGRSSRHTLSDYAKRLYPDRAGVCSGTPRLQCRILQTRPSDVRSVPTRRVSRS